MSTTNSNICYNRYGQSYYCQSSGWYNWGRWVLLGVIVVAAFLIFLGCSCLTARRRRKAGRKPFYGTGWAAAGPMGHTNQNYQPNYNQQQPAYGQYQPPNGGYDQNGGYYGGSNQAYFGGQQTGADVQRPQNTYYSGGEQVYQAPSGKPPGK